jgi:hypothetical protein
MGGFESKVHEILEHPEHSETAKEVFEALDKDANGTLDKSEYKIFIELLLGHDTDHLKHEV